VQTEDPRQVGNVLEPAADRNLLDQQVRVDQQLLSPLDLHALNLGMHRAAKTGAEPVLQRRARQRHGPEHVGHSDRVAGMLYQKA